MGVGKKLVKWAIGTTVAVGVPAGGYFGFIHDVATKDVVLIENYKIEDIAADLVANCLDYTKSEQKISLSVTEQAINSAAYNGLKDAGADAVISQFYCELGKGNYDFYLQIQNSSFFTVGTKIKIKTTLSEVVRSDYDNESCFVFKFKDIGIGRIGGIQNVATMILKNFITNEQIKESIGDQVHFTVDINKGEIVYPKSGLIKDIKNVLNGDTGDIPFASLLTCLFENDLVHLNTEVDEALRFDIDCTRFTQNSEYVAEYDLKLEDASAHDGISLGFINEKMALIFAANEGSNERKTEVFSFLFNGYDQLTSEGKEFIDSLNLACMGEGFNASTYKGFDLNGNSVLDKVDAQITGLKEKDVSYFTGETPFEVFKVSETDINAYLKTTPLVGFNFVLDRDTSISEDVTNGDGSVETITHSSFKTSYICIDNAYCNIYDETTQFVVGLNLNGLETNIIIPTTLNNEQSEANFATGKFTLTYDVGDIKLGDLTMNDAFKKDIFGLLAACSDDAFRFTTTGGVYQLTFDFSRSLTSKLDSSLSSLFSGCSFDFATKGANKEENGTITLKGKSSVSL